MEFRWSNQSRLYGLDGAWIPAPARTHPTGSIALDQFSDAICGFFSAIATRALEPVVTADQIEFHDFSGFPAFQCQTGGTTQSPKRLRRSCDSWTKTFEINAERFGPCQVYANCGHLSHSLTLYAVCEALVTGADFVHLPQGNAEQALDLMNAQGVSVLYATPTQVRYLFGRRCTIKLPKLGFVMIGGGALDVQTRQLISDVAPSAIVHEFYGAAETSFITLTDAMTPAGSVGRSWPGVEIEIRAANPQNGIGEIWVKSPYVFDGYTQGQSQDTRQDGQWMTVGEMGALDDNGYLTLAGRQSRMFTIADKNVFPEEIELVFKSVPGVLDCAVLPVPDRFRGQRAVLFVASDVGNIQRTLDSTARSHFAPYIRPQSYYILASNDWPVLASGKPDLCKLRGML